MATAPYPGIPALLAALAEAGIKTAVVSNKPDATTKTLAARFFPGLPAFGQRDDVPPKPAPDLVFRALETLGVDAADAVYVGDSEVDVATARNAGLPLAAVSWAAGRWRRPARRSSWTRRRSCWHCCNKTESVKKKLGK